jgi:tetratricopeptide (TPR) repeat protein
LEEAVELFQRTGFQWGLCITLEHLGRAMLELGEYEQAQASLERALALLEEFGTRWHMAWTLSALGRVMLAQQEDERARLLLQRSLGLHSEVENEWGVVISLMDFAALAIAQEDYTSAVRLSGAVYVRLSEFATPMPSETMQLLKTMEVEILPVARDHLGEMAYDDAWGQGKAVSLDKLITGLR